MNNYFNNIDKISFEGIDSSNHLAYKYYDPKRIVLGKTMEEQLRLAVCYWHTFCCKGADAFGNDTRHYPWNNGKSNLEQAENKLEAATQFVTKLGVKYLTFHDIDLSPAGSSAQEYVKNLHHMVDCLEHKLQHHNLKILWGTANLFTHPRYMTGAATTTTPEIFAYASLQVKHVIDATHRLGGQGYVLWGGREGYDTLLNTLIKQESEQFARFLSLVVDYKHKIGFKGSLFIEPKPCEPTKRQYDYDSATVYAFLQKYDLDQEFTLNIEANHATLAGHSFADEVAYACANNLLGSIDMNRGDPQNGWDTDQFPNSVEDITPVMYEIFKHGGLKHGGFNFDAKIRRQSTDLTDLFYGHIGAIDVLAKSLLVAETLIISKQLENLISKRYQGWQQKLGKDILSNKLDLEQLAQYALNHNIDQVYPLSGQQELCENILNQAIWNSQ